MLTAPARGVFLLSLLLAAVGIVATVALALGAVVAHALTARAGVVAALFGSVIVVLAGFPYLILLILFVAGASLATRFRLDEKSRRHVQEGSHGERGVANVVAHILIPTGLALTALGPPPFLSGGTRSLLYASALAFGASDTFASEFGVLAGHAKSILGLRPVEPGTNGGISGLGEVFAFVGAGITALFAVVLFALFGALPPDPILFGVVVTAAGFLGCQVDSVLGATLENAGYLSKHSTNFFGMLSSVAVAALVVGLVPGFR